MIDPPTESDVPPLPRLTGEKACISTKKATQISLQSVSVFLPLAVSTSMSILVICQSFPTTNRWRANLMLISGVASLTVSIALALVYIFVLMPAQRKVKQRKEDAG